jgi:hypothetical protein
VRPASPSPFRTYPDHAIDAIADRQLDRMRRAAEATMLASATTREVRARSPYRSTISVLLLLIIVIVAGSIVAAMVRSEELAGAAPAEAQPASPVRPAAGAK